MDENRVAGSMKEVKGAANDAIGWVVSDAKLRSDGEPHRSLGRIQNYGSGLSDAVRDADAMKSAGLLIATSIERGAGQ
jgi:uncharacterized protein YjbJ (UPF0337 family)